MSSRIEEYEKAHKENYVLAVKELIKNNTKAFIEDDMSPLFDKPPLDSMDMIKNKFILFAKEQKIVLQTEILEEIVSNYQEAMKKSLNKMGKIREESLLKYLDKFISGTDENIKILKKDFLQVDKQIQKNFKEALKENSEKYLIDGLPNLFKKQEGKEIDETLKKMQNYIKQKYIHQLLDSLDIKMLVKDTTLLNSIKEQTNRYLFTLQNSHLFD